MAGMAGTAYIRPGHDEQVGKAGRAVPDSVWSTIHYRTPSLQTIYYTYRVGMYERVPMRSMPPFTNHRIAYM